MRASIAWPLPFAFATATTCLVGGEATGAESDVTLAALLPKLATSSERFESMLRKASYSVVGHMESEEHDGVVSDRKDIVFRVRTVGARQRIDVAKYTEDGRDKTEKAREKAREDEEEEEDPDERAHMPFLGSEQAKYTFKIVEIDTHDRGRVRVYFTPKHPKIPLVVGSAWVDSRTGDVLSMGVSPAKTSLFVDYFRVTLEFGEHTPMGLAVSKIRFDGSGGFLFFHKRFRGFATLSDYTLP